MKHILIVFLFVLSFVSFGLDISAFPQLKHNLTQGVTLPEFPKFNDFSNAISATTKPYPIVLADENLFDFGIAQSWYHADFDSDPFDGMIEVFAIGQPSTSSTITLFLAGLISLMILYKKRTTLSIPS